MEPRHIDALLIGGGVAAARCARTLRRGGFGGSILLVGDESIPPYNRPPLSKELLRGEVERDLVLAEPATWYERRGVELALGAPVASLDAAARTATLADGHRLRYEQCLLATGATPQLPPVPGAEHALLLRTLADAQALRDRASAAGRAVVIGGGFIGVEVAASLASRGLRVTLLEQAAALWGGTLGFAISAWAAGHLDAAGVAVRLGAACTAIEPDAVHLGAERMPADLVVAGVGVRPRTDLAEAAGLELDDGVLVDERQEASAPAVFAAGDVARPRGGVRVEHWHAAREGGERAARGMLGQPVPPRRAPWVFSEFAGTTLDAFGWTGREARELALAEGVVGFVHADRLVGLAVTEGRLQPDAARSLVERGAALAEVRAAFDR